jgi:hypothetical protein
MMRTKGDGQEAYEAKRRYKEHRMIEQTRHNKAIAKIGKKKRKGE